MLEKDLLEQVRGLLASLKSEFTLRIERDPDYDKAAEFSSFLEDFASTSDKISTEYADGKDFRFTILRNSEDTGVSFRGIPNGHEFTSLLLAILNADGQGKNLPDKAIAARISRLKGELTVQTYVSLTCTNCPDVVQALNVMAIINPNLSHEMIDGSLFQSEISSLNIQGVPAVYVNGEPFHTGRGELGTLLQKLEDRFGTENDETENITEHKYDVVVVGGGPAGTASAIYSARKGLKVAIVAERIGGQTTETTGIENLISVLKTTGTQLAADMKTHIENYPIDIFENRKITRVSLRGKMKSVSVRGGEVFLSPAIVIATGASWRRL